MRKRLAPSAVRTAISLRRAVERASSKFAMFAQAISRTKATAPRSTSNDRRTSPTNRSCNFVTLMPQPLFVSL